MGKRKRPVPTLEEMEAEDAARRAVQAYTEAICTRCDQPRNMHTLVTTEGTTYAPVWVCPTATFKE